MGTVAEREVYACPDEDGESCVALVDRTDGHTHQLWLVLCGNDHFDVVVDGGEDGSMAIAAMAEEMLSLERRLAEARQALVDYALRNDLV